MCVYEPCVFAVTVSLRRLLVLSNSICVVIFENVNECRVMSIVISIHRCYLSGECVASLSVVDPILTERLEVIEPETFVMDCSRSAAAAAANLRKDGATKTEADRGSDYYSTRTSSS